MNKAIDCDITAQGQHFFAEGVSDAPPTFIDCHITADGQQSHSTRVTDAHGNDIGFWTKLEIRVDESTNFLPEATGTFIPRGLDLRGITLTAEIDRDAFLDSLRALTGDAPPQVRASFYLALAEACLHLARTDS